jgi:GntR family transcriptional regulator
MFDIDLMSRVPIYEQLYRRVIELVMKGVLKENDKLPSVRTLATDLGVNPNTVAKAYTLLERDGFICTLAGRGCFIAKPDTLLAQEQILSGFDEAAHRALDAGIGREILHKRIDSITDTKEEKKV